MRRGHHPARACAVFKPPILGLGSHQMPRPRIDTSAYYYQGQPPPWSMHAPAAVPYPVYPAYHGNGLASRAPNGKGQRRKGGHRQARGQMRGGGREQEIRVITRPDHYVAYENRTHKPAHQHKHVSVKDFAERNGVTTAGRKDSEIMDDVANAEKICVTKEGQLALLLPRLISAHHWEEANDFQIATGVLDLVNSGKIDCKFLKTLNPVKMVEYIQRAHKSAKSHQKRMTHVAPGPHGAAEATLAPAAGKLTSLRH